MDFFVQCEARTSQQATYSVTRRQELVRCKKKTRCTNNELHYTRVRAVSKSIGFVMCVLLLSFLVLISPWIHPAVRVEKLSSVKFHHVGGFKEKKLSREINLGGNRRKITGNLSENRYSRRSEWKNLAP